MFLERAAVVDAQAASDALLLHLPKAAVFEEIERNPKFARRMIAGLSQRVAEAHLQRPIERGILEEPPPLAGLLPERGNRLGRHTSLVCRSMKLASADTSSRSKTGTGASGIAPLAAMATTVGSSPASLGWASWRFRTSILSCVSRL